MPCRSRRPVRAIPLRPTRHRCPRLSYRRPRRRRRSTRRRLRRRPVPECRSIRPIRRCRPCPSRDPSAAPAQTMDPGV